MSVFLLIMGLLPLAILPEIMASSDEDETDDQPDQMAPDILQPVIGDDFADPDAEPVDPDLILQPEPDGPDTPGGQTPDSDPLPPVTEIEAENGTLSLDFEEVTASGYVEIENFDSEADILTILIEQGSLQGGADLEVVPAADPDDVEIWLEGQLVALLKNAADADESNVEVRLKS